MLFKAPRGTADILPADQPQWRQLADTARKTAEQFGYRRIDTPTFENTHLFERSVGEETDVVQKEMYTFEDHGGDLLTLRPEGTASVCRAYLQHGMHNLPQPVRLHYLSRMYRYERPQAGRFRQHHQFGVEAIGDPAPQVDAEVIELGWRYLSQLGVSGLTIKLNTIGDANCRPYYLETLLDYYRGKVKDMCADCKYRMTRNPLRLLDCKNDACTSFATEAPAVVDHLCSECRDHWTEVRALVENLKVHYPTLTIMYDHRLVRGLDYYNRTVFEIHPPEHGAQSSILSGGRYDGLIEHLGGKQTPGVGFGSGVERALMNVQHQRIEPPPTKSVKLVLISHGDKSRFQLLSLAIALRKSGESAIVAPAGRSVKSQMRFANAIGARFALILGEKELEQEVLLVKPLDGSGEQRQVPLNSGSVQKAVGSSA